MAMWYALRRIVAGPFADEKYRNERRELIWADDETLVDIWHSITGETPVLMRKTPRIRNAPPRPGDDTWMSGEETMSRSEMVSRIIKHRGKEAFNLRVVSRSATR